MDFQATAVRLRESVCIERAHGMRAHQICRAYRGKAKALGTKVVIVDYLQLMPGLDPRAARHEQLEASMQVLADLAADEGICVLVLSQFNRQMTGRGEKGEVPKLSDLRGSGAIEQVGKLIIALSCKDKQIPELRMTILKNYQGPAGYVIAHYNRELCDIR